MITRHTFGLESPNLHQAYILRNSRLVLKMGVIDLDLQGHFGHFDKEFLEMWLVFVTTYNGFELESPNLHQICILGFSRLVLKMEVIDIDLQGLAIVSTQETAFNVDHVYWSRPANGCYTSQTCSCFKMRRRGLMGWLRFMMCCIVSMLWISGDSILLTFTIFDYVWYCVFWFVISNLSIYQDVIYLSE